MSVRTLMLVLGVSLLLQGCGNDHKKANNNVNAANAAAQELAETYGIDVTPHSEGLVTKVQVAEAMVLRAGFWYFFKTSGRERIRQDLNQIISSANDILKAVDEGKVKDSDSEIRAWSAELVYAEYYRESLDQFEGRPVHH